MVKGGILKVRFIISIRVPCVRNFISDDSDWSKLSVKEVSTTFRANHPFGVLSRCMGLLTVKCSSRDKQSWSLVLQVNCPNRRPNQSCSWKVGSIMDFQTRSLTL